jgi:hypothetical protein
MKLLDTLINRMIDRSEAMRVVVDKLKLIALTVEDVSLGLRSLARTACAHQAAIEDLYLRHDALMQTTKEAGMDLELRQSLSGEKTEKPN